MCNVTTDRPGCPTPEELIAYLKGTLPEDEAQKVEAHIQLCLECADELDFWETTFKLWPELEFVETSTK